MNKKIMIALLLLCILVCGASAETKLVAQGSATVTGEADLVILTAGVTISADTVAVAQNTANSVVAKATEALTALGLDPSDVTTQSYYFYPNYDYSSSSTVNRVVGYQASHTVRITCGEIGMLDSVVSALTESGMTEIMDISFAAKNSHDLYLTALKLACEDAREKALVMAESEGLTIVAPLEIMETGMTSGAVYKTESRDAAMGNAGKLDATGITSGGVSMTANVVVTYETR